MVLLKDEYIKMEAEFLDIYSEDIKRAVYAERNEFLEEQMKEANFLEFVKKYMGFAALSLIVLFLAWTKYAISNEILFGATVFVLVIFMPAYWKWKQDMKDAALDAYFYKSKQIIADFVYQKMREVVLNSRVGVDFEKNVQFYSIALYNIPRNFYVNVHNDNFK